MGPRTLPLLAMLVAALALALTAAPAEASVIAPREAHSPNAEDIRTTYWVALAVAGFLALLAHAAFVVAVLRFRARRGRRPGRVVARRGFFARAGVPLAAVAAALFVFGVVMTSEVREIEPSGPAGLQAARSLTAQVGVSGLPPEVATEGEQSATGEPAITGEGPAETAPLQISAIAQQWLWRFEYPTGDAQPPADAFSYHELVVPVDTTVVLNITSTDVQHRWFVPALGGQVDAIPGQVTQTWFRADREGSYPGQSTAYSGAGYSVMRIRVRVVSPQEYEEFVAANEQQLGVAQAWVQRKITEGATVGGVTLP